MSRVLFEHPICRAVGFPVQTRAGEREYLRLEMADWVNVVPVTDDDRVVLIRQHRFGIDRDTLEIPGGIVDPGEDPAAAAARELREETGYGGGVLEPLGSTFPNPAIQDNRMHHFVAREIRRVGEPVLDPGEDIAVELVARERIPDLLASGAIAHALVVVALQRWLLQG